MSCKSLVFQKKLALNQGYMFQLNEITINLWQLKLLLNGDDAFSSIDPRLKEIKEQIERIGHILTLDLT